LVLPITAFPELVVRDAELVDMAVEGIGEFRLPAAQWGEPKKRRLRFSDREDRHGQLSGHREWGEKEGEMNKGSSGPGHA
jgi:hypothetical protein